MKRAVIVGSAGQDGRLLFDRLTSEGLHVLGVERTKIRNSLAGTIAPLDILNTSQVEDFIQRFRPDEVYYLAAYHHSSEEHPSSGLRYLQHSFATHVTGLLGFLEAIVRCSPSTRLFYAASSHVFGSAEQAPQDENTPFMPVCAYGISKTAGIHCCRFYRTAHSAYAAAGILYNHESPFRRRDFVSRKIIRAVIQIERGAQTSLVLGDLNAEVDWGYALDFVDAMVRILRLEEPEEFVVATGQPRTVREFARIAFESRGMDWTHYVKEDPSTLKRPSRNLVGNPEKLVKKTGWCPTVTLEQMVALLLQAEEESH